jgi:hypothetical protein
MLLLAAELKNSTSVKANNEMTGRAEMLCFIYM